MQTRYFSNTLSNYFEDTIVAISTPLGLAGLGIVRLSGPQAFSIAEQIFSFKNKNKNFKELKNFTVHLGYIIDKDNTVVDEVLMTVMQKPRSFTCEDVVEFSCHGNAIILQQVVELCLKYGARIAQPGEFTKRAFLNGRIDLTEAEAVSQIISSKTKLHTKLATHSLLGHSKKKIEDISQKIKHIIASLEAQIDFPEDVDYLNSSNENIQLINEIIKIKESIKNSIENYNKFSFFNTFTDVAIIGKPNVGKSSLLNLLVNQERAIVSDIPGTTRDLISEYINLKDISIRLVDTAGIRLHCQDPIEKKGIQKTKQAIQEAKIIILLLDAITGITQEDINIITLINESSEDKTVILVLNKIDLLVSNSSYNNSYLEYINLFRQGIKIKPQKKENIEPLNISCLKKLGIEELEEEIINTVTDSNDMLKLQNIFKEPEEHLIITTLRQKELLEASYAELELATSKNSQENLELLTEHLKNSLKYILNITGGDLTEDVLNIIFSNFCVGK